MAKRHHILNLEARDAFKKEVFDALANAVKVTHSAQKDVM